MTIGELIEKLSKYDSGAEVELFGDIYQEAHLCVVVEGKSVEIWQGENS